MALISKEQKLADAIIEHPSIVTVLNRFGIFLGVGDRSVEQAASQAGLNTDFFVTILNTFTCEEYFPERSLKSFDVRLIIDYLNSTNAYYRQYILPNIENHFQLLLRRSTGSNTNLTLLLQFFMEVKGELLGRIDDDATLFAEIAALDHGCPVVLHQSDDAAADAIEEKIGDLVNMFVIHLTGRYDANLCVAVLSAVINLKRDLRQNNRIRHRILMPIYHYLTSHQADA